jgi:acetyl-CoA decarbonylase/synthase complex subunit gamma
MQLANLKVELSACPDASEAAKAALGAASAPPVKLVTVGVGDVKLGIGDEKVLFRHEKTFYHAPPLVGIVEDAWDDAKVSERAKAVKALSFERVGRMESMNAVAVVHTATDASRMVAAARVAHEASGLPLVLISSDAAAMGPAVEAVAASRPLLVSSAPSTNAAIVALAKQHKCAVAVCSDGGLEGLADEAKAAKAAGVEEVVLLMRGELSAVVEDMVMARRLAILKNFRELGYPMLNLVDGEDAAEDAITAAVLLIRYSSMLVLRHYSPELILPLVTLRLNIYTDPQKPIQVKAGVYNIGEPGPDSPLMLTSNFSLTYFSVAGDVDKSKIPSRILVVDTEGLSVMTAFAAGKMDPEKMAKALEDSGLATMLPKKEVIIPGMISRASGKLQELSGWKIVVGPRESSGIPSFLRNR